MFVGFPVVMVLKQMMKGLDVRVAALEYSQFIKYLEVTRDPEIERVLFFISFLPLELFAQLPGSMFSTKYKWLVNIKEENLKNFFFPFSSHVHSVSIEGEEIVVKEHYNIAQDMPRQVTNTIATWTGRGRLNLTTLSIWERRADLQGYKFVAETMDEAPYVDFKLNDDKTVDHVDGIVGDIWHGLFERSLNFSTKISEPPDNAWGSLNEDGSCSNKCPVG